MRKSQGGRPSKGKREQVATRLRVPLAEAARNRASDLGLTMNDYLAELVVTDIDVSQVAALGAPRV